MVNYKALALAATLCLAGLSAWAQQPGFSNSVTSGPASGTNVKPSSAEGRSSTGDNGASSVGGAPGVQAKSGTEAGSKPSGMKNADQ